MQSYGLFSILTNIFKIIFVTFLALSQNALIIKKLHIDKRMLKYL